MVASSGNDTIIHDTTTTINSTNSIESGSTLIISNSTVELDIKSVPIMLESSDSQLVLGESAITILGLNMTGYNTISYKSESKIIVNGTASFSGLLTIKGSARKLTFSYTNFSGRFSGINLESDNCSTSSAEYTDSQLTVLFSPVANCDGFNPEILYYTLLPITLLFIISVVIVFAVKPIRRKILPFRDRKRHLFDKSEYQVIPDRGRKVFESPGPRSSFL